MHCHTAVAFVVFFNVFVVAFTVNVTGVNDAPTIEVDKASLSVTEDGSADSGTYAVIVKRTILF